jgi:hypothetical protein
VVEVAMKYLILCILFMVIGCDGESTMTEKENLPLISDVPESAWKSLSQKKIYFGHQSVGGNIIDGVNKVMENNDLIKLNIKNTADVQAFDSPVFAHSDIGNNGDIDSKLDDFSKNIRKGLGDKADLAFLKLCFWDVRRSTDINEVFNDYKKTITDLKIEYPSTKFVHLTVPLMSHSNGVIAKIKRMIKPDNADLDNIKRNELNRLIVAEYGGKEPLFDIARIESTLPNGVRATFSADGGNYYYLPDEYTDDGGHLNEQASKYVAEQLLITLALLEIK